MNPHIQSYFEHLFTSEVNQTDPTLLAKVETKVIEHMNSMLLAPFTVDDVGKVAFSIEDLKASGPDGLHAVFLSIGLFLVTRSHKRF